MTRRGHRGCCSGRPPVPLEARPAAILASVLALLSVGLGCARSPDAPTLEWLRRGTAYVVVTDPVELRISVEPTHGGADYAYLYGPDGRTLVRRRLSPDYAGTVVRRLTTPGVYTVVPSPSHRMRLRADGARLVYRPETEFPSLHQRDGGAGYTFRVPEGTERMTVAATNQHDWSGSAARVRIFDPDGRLAHTFELDDLDEATILERVGVSAEQLAFYRAQGDTAVVPEFRLVIERWTATDPAPGSWRVEAGTTGLEADDVGFWLEGIDNLIAPVGESPELPGWTDVDVSATVDAARVVGPTGDVGTVWGWTVHEAESEAAYREMGLSASKHFYPQIDMEAINDDDDPRHIDPAGFDFAPYVSRLDAYADQRIPLTALMAITRPTAWATKNLEEIAEFAEAAVSYHQIDRDLSPDALYWQFLNEPNHDVHERDYVLAYQSVGRRLAERIEAGGVPVHFGGPATGNAAGDTRAVPWSWIESLLRHADDVTDFVVWNQYRLPRLEDTWRYRAHVARADSLIRALDSDGQREEILIGATNLRGGIVLQNERQDGPYSALWWPSVLCQTLGTGRCRLINYFFLIDHGARRKGLLHGDWRRKPVAHATAFVTSHLGTHVIGAEIDHDGLDVLATRGPVGRRGDAATAVSDADPLHVLVVNRLDRAARLRLLVAGAPAAARVEASLFVTDTGEVRALDTRSNADDAGSRFEVRVPPRTLAAWRLLPGG